LRVLDFLGASNETLSNPNFLFLFPLEASWDALRREAHGEHEIEEQEQLQT
jgi:hypothetical protein